MFMFVQDYVLHWKPVLSANATLYLQVALSALLCWDDATKQRVLFESFVLSGQTDGKMLYIAGIFRQGTLASA